MKRIPELDSIRGIAAILIIIFHYAYPSDFYDRIAYCFGPVAMELFFCLSGYLITSIIVTNGDQEGFLKSFFMRRGLRIWPAYYLTVFAYMALIAFRPSMGDLSTWPYYVTYTQTVPAMWGGENVVMNWPLGPTWSLSVEEQFYVFWPLCLLAIGIRNRWRLFGFMLLVTAASMAVRAFGGSEQTLVGRSDGFALGGLLALAGHFPALGHRSRTFLFVAILALSLLFHGWAADAEGTRFLDDVIVRPWGMPIHFRTTLAFAVIGLAVEFTGSPCLAPLRMRALAYLGKISYGLYLYHLTGMLLAGVVLRHHSRTLPPATPQLLAGLLTLAMAFVSYRYVEQPFLRMKNLFNYESERKQAAMATSGSND